jgi:hypothetical protein
MEDTEEDCAPQLRVETLKIRFKGGGNVEIKQGEIHLYFETKASSSENYRYSASVISIHGEFENTLDARFRRRHMVRISRKQTSCFISGPASLSAIDRSSSAFKSKSRLETRNLSSRTI